MTSSPPVKRPQTSDDDEILSSATSVVVQQEKDTWLKCAGAAVLNSQNHVLVGQCIILNGTQEQSTWQCPEGSVKHCHEKDARAATTVHDDNDDKQTNLSSLAPQGEESIAEASSRALLRETGLKVGTHVMAVNSNSKTTTLPLVPAVRYRAFESRLTKGDGYTGRELHWTIFRCMDARGDEDPTIMCTLQGSNDNDNNNKNEAPEFSTVAWQPIETVVDHVWHGKREPYRALQKTLENIVYGQWQEQLKGLDFTGTWLRDWMDAAEALMQRGLSYEEAVAAAERPYVQKWERGTLTAHSWLVTTYHEDGRTPRRELEYQEGEWDESYQGTSTLFGPSGSDGTTLRRRTCYVVEPEADPPSIAHATITFGPKGVEETRRYLKAGQMTVRRTLWSKEAPDDPVVSTEIFFRSTLQRD